MTMLRPSRVLSIGAFAGLALFALLPLRAAPIERDLGQGLRYVRTTTLPADLPAASLPAGPLVLDLRFAVAGDEASTALGAWLKFRASPKNPVFVLLNRDTAPALIESLASPQRPAGVITLGQPTHGFAPDFVVNVKEDEARRAFEALAANTPVEALVTENQDKPRNDEASIARALQQPPAEPADPELTDGDVPPPEKPAPAPTLTDRVLQRAIQLHRALRALGRI